MSQTRISVAENIFSRDWWHY